MSIVSSWLFNEPQRDAQERQQNMAGEQADWFKNLFGGLRTDFDKGLAGAKTNETDMYGRQQDALNNFFTAEQGPIATMMNSIRSTGRQQAAQSGLIGGGQEAMFTTPLLADLQQRSSSAMAGQQSDLLGRHADRMGGFDMAKLQQLTSLLGPALGGVQGAFGGQQGAAGQYTPGPMDNILKLIDAGVNVASLFAGVPPVGAAKGLKK